MTSDSAQFAVTAVASDDLDLVHASKNGDASLTLIPHLSICTVGFLGFAHFCGQRNRDRAFIVWRITAKKRMVAKLKAIKAELQRRKHHRTTEVGAWFRKVVLGYYQYHAVPGNSAQLRIFSRRVCRLWRSILVRRSQRAQVRWDRLSPVLNRWIPQPRILHPYPNARFAATHPR
jgi:RNA-directed DNA polymerase